MSDSECLFCRIAEGAIPADVIHESERLVAFRDINPQAPLHLLIIPKEHIASLEETDAGHRDLLGEILLLAGDLARTESVAESGYRCVINTGDEGGQTVHHLHLHLLAGRSMGWPPG